MRILGIDPGEKRMGVAISDPLGITAQGLETIQRISKEEDIKKITELIERYKVEKIIMGLPIHMDGTQGKQAKQAKKFANLIKKQVQIPIEFWDERLSTVQAQKSFLQANVHWKKAKHSVDRISAQIILQGYLDSLRF